jgi:hypothetical protein
VEDCFPGSEVDYSAIRADLRAILNGAVDRKSSPGFPLCRIAKDNGQLIDEHEVFVLDCAIERIKAMMCFDTTQNTSPKQLVVAGICGPCKVFVKNEPHNVSKLESGSLRLIMVMDAIDNLIARFLFTHQNKTEIAHWSNTPSKPGMGLDDKGTQQIYKTVAFENYFGTLAQGDVKGWDWSMQECELQHDLERRITLNKGSGSVWEKLARVHFHCIARKLFVLSDGRMFSQIKPGVMPSGWFNTSSTNSFVRVLNHHVIASMDPPVQRPYCMAMGDDSIERYLPDAVSRYETIGKTVTMYESIQPYWFEFCSTRFFGPLGYPTRVDKQLVNFFQKKPATQLEANEMFDQLVENMRHLPNLREIISLIADLDWWRGFNTRNLY